MGGLGGISELELYHEKKSQMQFVPHGEVDGQAREARDRK